MIRPDITDIDKMHASRINNKDKIYSQIKMDIIRCILKPGSAISEAKLAMRYNVGKAPVRDALARLGHEGFVISQARKGHLVAPITIQDVIDLYGVRMALEPVAARLAAGRVDEDHLRQAARACEIAVDESDPGSVSRFLRANSEFHKSIASASGNRRLAKQISDLLDDTERVRQVMIGTTGSRKEAITEHEALVEALVVGDKAEAESMTKTHIQRGWRMVLSSLLSQFRFMDLNIGGPLEETSAEILLHGDISGAVSGSTNSSRVVDFSHILNDAHIERAAGLPSDFDKKCKKGNTNE